MTKVRSKQQLSKEIDEIKRKCCCAGGSYESITYEESLALVESATLDPGTLYRITGVHKNKVDVTIPVLYDDGNNSGTTIYLTALTTSEFSTEGWGEFYNPKYDQATYGAVDGTGVYLYNIWDGDNPDAGVTPSYGIDRKIIWGGYVWTNTTGALGTATSVVELEGTDWTKVAYNTTDYNFVIDYIEYDWVNDWILRRRQAEPVIDVIFPYQYWNSVENTYGVVLHGISVMQWGNNYKAATELGIGLIEIKDAYAELINFKGKLFLGLSLTEYSVKKGDYYGIDTEFRSVILVGKSYQTANTFDTGAKQTDVLLESQSYQDQIIIRNDSYQEKLRLINGSYQNGEDNMLLDNVSYQVDVTLMNQSYQQGIYDNGSAEIGASYINDAYSTFTLDNSQLYYWHIDRSVVGHTLINCTKYNLIFKNGLATQPTDSNSTEKYSIYGNTSNEFNFKVTFTGAAGLGAVGAVTIPILQLSESGMYIEEVIITSDGLSGGVGSYITLGIVTDDVDSGLTAVTGLVTTINNATLRYTALPFTQTAAEDRYLVMAVGANAITGGTVVLNVKTRYSDIL
jgi:hypothetical protein